MASRASQYVQHRRRSTDGLSSISARSSQLTSRACQSQRSTRPSSSTLLRASLSALGQASTRILTGRSNLLYVSITTETVSRLRSVTFLAGVFANVRRPCLPSTDLTAQFSLLIRAGRALAAERF